MKPFVFAAALLCGGAAYAQVAVQAPWVRATVSSQKVTGAFMQLTAIKDARLVAASSPVAGKVEIHEMKIEGNVMKMREIAGLTLPAGKPVELRPGGYHVMLMDLKQALPSGSKVALTLVVEGADGKRENVEVQADVRALADATAHGHDHDHAH